MRRSELRQIVVAGTHKTLQLVVAALIHLDRAAGEDAAKRTSPLLVAQIHAWIIPEVGFRDTEFDAVRSLYGQRQESQAPLLPLGNEMVRIGVLE